MPVPLPAVRITLGNTPVDLVRRDEFVDLVIEHLSDRSTPSLFVASANLDHVNHFSTLSPTSETMKDQDGVVRWLILLDGTPLVWMARLLTGAPHAKLAGSDLLPLILPIAEAHGVTVGFLGGSTDMQTKLREVIAEKWPTLSVSGFWAPERSVLCDRSSSETLARRIAEAHTDMLVTSLGKPLQEEWLSRYAEVLGVRIVLAFGAATDFLSGHARRAPIILQRAGLEWAFRLFQEPRRLWKRYLIFGPRSVFRLLIWSRKPRHSVTSP